MRGGGTNGCRGANLWQKGVAGPFAASTCFCLAAARWQLPKSCPARGRVKIEPAAVQHGTHAAVAKALCGGPG